MRQYVAWFRGRDGKLHRVFLEAPTLYLAMSALYNNSGLPSAQLRAGETLLCIEERGFKRT